MSDEWNIRSRGAACNACEKPFEDGQACWSILRFSPEGYERRDYCEPCREDPDSETSGDSCWRGVFRLPPPPPDEPIKKQNAESIVRRMIAEEDERIGAIYVLAVMLERKKVLVERDIHEREDGGRMFVYEHRETGETFPVRDPQLRLDQLQDVQLEVMEMLGLGPKEGEEETRDEPSEDEEPVPLRPEDIPDSGFV